MEIKWTTTTDPIPIYLGSFRCPVPGCEDLHVFGTRHELSEALIDGESLGPGYFLEFVVTWKDKGEYWVAKRLLQHQSVTYSEARERGDYVGASGVFGQEALCITARPVWKASEATWPTSQGKPMQFVGQISLPDTQSTRELFTWGFNVYVFCAHRDGAPVVKIVTQEASFQTAEEHYALEDDDT